MSSHAVAESSSLFENDAHGVESEVVSEGEVGRCIATSAADEPSLSEHNENYETSPSPQSAHSSVSQEVECAEKALDPQHSPAPALSPLSLSLSLSPEHPLHDEYAAPHITYDMEKESDEIHKNTEQYLCQICLDTHALSPHPSLQYYALSQCRHVFCRECIKQFLSVNIREGRVQLRCFFVRNMPQHCEIERENTRLRRRREREIERVLSRGERERVARVSRRESERETERETEREIERETESETEKERETERERERDPHGDYLSLWSLISQSEPHSSASDTQSERDGETKGERERGKETESEKERDDVCGAEITREDIEALFSHNALSQSLTHDDSPTAHRALSHNEESDRDTLRRYERFSLLQSHSDARECPHCHTLSVVEASETHPRIVCESCEGVYCFTHSNAHDFGVYPTCEEYDKAMSNALGESETLIRNETKPCPRCGMAVMKSGGCNHMKCRCGAAFCWLCGQQIEDETFPTHFQWWNPAGCPNMQMNEDINPSPQTRIIARILATLQLVFLGPITLISTAVSFLLCCCCIVWKIRSNRFHDLSLNYLSGRLRRLFGNCMASWGMIWLFLLCALPLGLAAGSVVAAVVVAVCSVIYPCYAVARLHQREYPWPDALTRATHRVMNTLRSCGASTSLCITRCYWRNVYFLRIRELRARERARERGLARERARESELTGVVSENSPSESEAISVPQRHSWGRMLRELENMERTLEDLEAQHQRSEDQPPSPTVAVGESGCEIVNENGEMCGVGDVELGLVEKEEEENHGLTTQESPPTHYTVDEERDGCGVAFVV